MYREKLDNTYHPSSFQEVRDAVFSDPFSKENYPIHDVNVGTLINGFKNRLYTAAHKAIHEKHDIRPRFDKLIHSNGMGFSGKWEITEDSPYTGLFAKGSEALMVARISAILTATDYDSRRGFGFAAKLFPTVDVNEKVETVDLILLDTFVGRPKAYASDVTITNHPTIGVAATLIEYIGVLSMTLLSFPLVDMPLTYRPAVRVASVGIDEESDILSPTWVMVRVRDTAKEKLSNFRDELAVSNQVDEEVVLDLYVSEHKKGSDGLRDWTRIGLITLTESVVSDATDHRLHFHHPKTKRTRFLPKNAGKFVPPSGEVDIRI